MASTIPLFGLRLPPDLKAWLADQAAANLRSLNCEILKRLEERMARQAGVAKEAKEEKVKP